MNGEKYNNGGRELGKRTIMESATLQFLPRYGDACIIRINSNGYGFISLSKTPQKFNRRRKERNQFNSTVLVDGVFYSFFFHLWP